MLVVFDLDGVLADPSHRKKYEGGDWVEWNKHCFGDAAIHHGIMLLQSIIKNRENSVIFCTSRYDMSKQDTLKWLNKHAGVYDWDIYCRGDEDNRNCHLVKEDLFRLIIEDYGVPDLFIEDSETNAKHIYDKFKIPYLICKFPTKLEVTNSNDTV